MKRCTSDSLQQLNILIQVHTMSNPSEAWVLTTIFGSFANSMNPSNKLLQFSSVAQSCPTPCDPMDYTAHQASLSITNSRSLLKLLSTESVMPSNHFNINSLCFTISQNIHFLKGSQIWISIKQRSTLIQSIKGKLWYLIQGPDNLK